MADITRGLTAGEIAMLSSVFGSTIPYAKVKVHNYKAYFFQPDDTAMTPDGEVYFPPAHFQGDIARDFYKLKNGVAISKPYKLSDYATILPFPP
jgi:hypothetical protein